MKSPPRQTWSTPRSPTACSRWSITRSIVRCSWSIASGCSISPSRPPRSASCAQLLVVEVAWMVVDRAAGCVRDEHAVRRRYGRAPRRRVPREAWARSRITRARTSRSTSSRPRRREPAVLGCAVGDTGCAGSRSVDGHAHAELPERLGRPELVAERLDALRARASGRSGLRARPRRGRLPVRTWSDPRRRSRAPREANEVACPSASRSVPSGCRSSSTKIGHTCKPTPPASSSGSHVRAKTPAFSVPMLAVRELQQQVEVGVGDHDGIITSRPPSCSFSPSLTKPLPPFSLLDRHTNPMPD